MHATCHSPCHCHHFMDRCYFRNERTCEPLLKFAQCTMSFHTGALHNYQLNVRELWLSACAKRIVEQLSAMQCTFSLSMSHDIILGNILIASGQEYFGHDQSITWEKQSCDPPNVQKSHRHLLFYWFDDISECCNGPGYATPLEAMKNAPKEKLVYLPCIQVKQGKKDYLATVVVDPTDRDYGKVSQQSALGA